LHRIVVAELSPQNFHEAHCISKQTVNQGEKDLKDMGLMFPE